MSVGGAAGSMMAGSWSSGGGMTPSLPQILLVIKDVITSKLTSPEQGIDPTGMVSKRLRVRIGTLGGFPRWWTEPTPPGPELRFFVSIRENAAIACHPPGQQ